MRIEAVSGRASEAREVAAHRTPVHPADIRKALAAAHKKLTGRPATEGMLDVLTAHVGLETAQGQRMFNFNFGGIKGKSPDGDTARYQTREVIDGEERKLVDGFRAYDSVEAGARDYLKLLKGRYGAALDRAETGDVTGFARELKGKGYYTAPLEGYTRGLASLLDAPLPDREGYESFRAMPANVDPWSLGIVSGPEGLLMPTQTDVARVMDAVASMTARVGAPVSDSERDDLW